MSIVNQARFFGDSLLRNSAANINNDSLADQRQSMILPSLLHNSVNFAAGVNRVQEDELAKVVAANLRPMPLLPKPLRRSTTELKEDPSAMA